MKKEKHFNTSQFWRFGSLFLVISISLVIALISFSCHTGLGGEIDMVGPELRITSHENLDFDKPNFTLSGTAIDNVKVTRIEGLVTASNSSENTETKTFSASINGENWSARLNLSEGEQTIEVTAYDKNNNTSHLSKKVITLLIDDTPPFVGSLELVRATGFRGTPLALELLKTKDPDNSQDLNIFHNEDLRFEASIIEDFNMKDLVLNIHDEEGNIVSTLPNSGTNDKAPIFNLTQEMLTTANPKYSSGLHYFRITMEGYDMAENSIDAHNTDQFLWFAWYAGADYPHIEQGQAKENGHTEIPVIEIPVGNSLSFNFWDDDAIESIYLKKIETSDWNAVSGSNDTDKLSYLEGNKTDRETLLGQALSTNSGQAYGQTFSTQLSVGEVPGEYRIVAMVQDKKGDPSKAKWTSRVYRLLVSDENAPITFIEEPAQNTVPTVNTAGDFEIKGYTIDNVGTDTLLMAWIPFGSNISQEVAKDALKESTITAGSSTTLSNGLVIYNISLGTSSNQNIGGIQYKKKEFTLSLNIFESFKYKGTSQNQEKNFVFLAKDGHGNEVFQSLKLLADTAPPKITIHSPDGDLKVHNIENDLTLSFSANKASGLSIPTMEIWDYTGVPQNLNATQTGNTASITILNLSESRRTYRFIAKDALGNEAFEQATIIISSLPTLQYISSNAANRTYKAEDSIILTAKFSKAVKVTGRPRLRIRYSASDTTEKYATYTSGSGTDTLLFTWKVPSGAVSSDLRSHSTPIDLNGGSIQTTEGSGGSAFIAGLGNPVQPSLSEGDTLQGRKNLVIDGVSPTFESLTFPGAKSAYKAGESFTATLKLSEPVLVNGIPVLQFIGNNNSTLTASFQKVSENEIYFTFTVKKDQNATNLSYNSSSFISNLTAITDLAGNPLTLSGDSTNTGIIIDTSPPAVPTVTGIDDGETYNRELNITLDDLETGATVQYSLNGGLSWDDYPSTGVRVEDDGNYTFIAYQMDAVGNCSDNTDPISFEVDRASPTLTAVSCDTPDGSYGIGETLRFKLFFSEKVRTNGAGATITIAEANNPLSDTKTVSVTENTTGAASLEFVYKIVEGDNFKPVKITSVNLENITDLNGNAATNPTTVPSLNRPNLHADAVKPIVSSRSPGINAVAESRNTLVIEFNENIFVEQGVIEIARAGDWYLPLYLEEEEFKSIYYSNALTADEKSNLMITEPGSDTALLHYLTGQALGPYKETTHGLIENVNGNAVPDTSTKYVLDFPFSSAGTEEVIYQLSANTTRKITGAQIREVLEKAGYHKHSIDVGSTAVTIENKRVTATIPVDLAIGREWTVTIPAGAFRDAAGNTNEEISWNFWTDQVATPVIRVERYSHGEGAIEPVVNETIMYNSDTKILETTAPTFGTSRTVGHIDKTTIPSGYVRVRIDCETPGATIQFGAIQHTHPEVTTTTVTNDPRYGSSSDIVYSTLTGLTRGATYSNIFALGDGILNTAGKYYVAASATKANLGQQSPALGQSATGYEGAFKSIIHYRNPGSGGSYLRFQGSNIQGGMPTIAGFPLRDADPDLRFTKHAYQVQNTTDWYWHSWEIVCDWYNQSTRTNWQNPPNYPLNKYGNWLFINAKTYHDGGPWTNDM